MLNQYHVAKSPPTSIWSLLKGGYFLEETGIAFSNSQRIDITMQGFTEILAIGFLGFLVDTSISKSIEGTLYPLKKSG